MDQILNYDKNKSFEDYYETLGCDENSSLEQIYCEYKIRALSLHPDKNPFNTPQNENNFKKLQKAKEILTDSQKRKSYDKWRSSGISMTFEDWSKLGKDVHNSMHWIKSNKNGLMLECSPGLETDSKRDKPDMSRMRADVWNRDTGDDMLTKFRNYQI